MKFKMPKSKQGVTYKSLRPFEVLDVDDVTKLNCFS